MSKTAKIPAKLPKLSQKSLNSIKSSSYNVKNCPNYLKTVKITSKVAKNNVKIVKIISKQPQKCLIAQISWKIALLIS